MPNNEVDEMIKSQNQVQQPEKIFDHSDQSGSSSGVSEDEEHDFDPKLKKHQSVRMPSSDIGERFHSLPTQSHEKFLRVLFDTVLSKAVLEGTDRDNKVLEWTDPEELQRKFDMSLKDEPDSDEELLKLANDTIKYSVKTGHPYFVNQLFSCVDPYGFAGQLITDALNPSVYTYEVSPAFILMEEVVLKEMRKIVGYQNGDGDGIFCPGGSAANGYAISCARYKYFPDVKVSAGKFSFHTAAKIKKLKVSQNHTCGCHDQFSFRVMQFAKICHENYFFEEKSFEILRGKHAIHE